MIAASVQNAIRRSFPNAGEDLRLGSAFVALGALVAVIVSMRLLLPPEFTRGVSAYLPFHIAAEVFAIAVALMISAIGWHAYGTQPLRGVALVACAFLSVGLLDLAHMLSFPGMQDFVTPSSTAKGINFWLAARLTAAVALLTFVLMPQVACRSDKNRYRLLAVALAWTALVWWAGLFRPQWFPQTFIAGEGLTPFKVGMEYLIIGLHLATMGVLAWHRVRRPYNMARLFLASGAMVLSELCFTLYSDAADAFNLLGHAYKVFAYIYLYQAIVVENVREPYLRIQTSERAYRESEEKFRRLMEFAPDAILLIDLHGLITMVNARAEEMFGVSRLDLVGRPVESLVSERTGEHCRVEHFEDGPAAPVRFETQCRIGDRAFPAEVSLGNLRSSDEALTIATVRDISERKLLEAELSRRATHDPLTGLPNRVLCMDRLEQAVAHARRKGSLVAVAFIDLDHFKNVNDTLGHGQGDALLIQAAARFGKVLRHDDTLARQGGDEFIVVMRDVAHAEEAAAASDRLLALMDEPFHIEGREIFLSASIGLSLYPVDEESTDGLLRNADIALYRAKKEGRRCYRFHTGEMDRVFRERLALESELRHAVARGELELFYQPRLVFESNRMTGMEALLRWRHSEMGMISPERFVPIAEESSLIESIGEWALRTACVQCKSWLDAGLPRLIVSVNLSARQFRQPDLARRVAQALEDAKLPASHLELEITESTVMHDTESAVRTLNELKALGVTLSVDDFGTGYSSLSYLKQFPIDVLKIDQSFVRDVPTDPDDSAIVRAIVALAHSLNLTVTAEGVETREQCQFLIDCGCDEGQGYLFSRPLDTARFEQLARQGVIAPDKQKSSGHG